MNRWRIDRRTGMLAAFAATLVTASMPLVWLGFPCPRGDDAVYKSPGAEWAAHGRMTVPALTGLLATSQQGFAHYPPIYPLAYGLWYLALGFSLQSTLAFSHLVHVVQTTLATVVCWRLLTRAMTFRSNVCTGISIASGLMAFMNWAYFDRPEEMALVFIWIGFLWFGFQVGAGRPRRIVAEGVFVGLATLIAPFVGLLGVLLVISGELPWQDKTTNHPDPERGSSNWSNLFIFGGVVGTMVAGWMFVLEWRFPGMLNDQLFEGNLAFSAGAKGVPYFDRLMRVTESLTFNPSQLPTLVIPILFLPMAWRQGELRSRPAARLWLVALLGLTLVVFLRPTAYTYIGAAQMLIAPSFGLVAARFVAVESVRGKVGAALVGLCVLFAGMDLYRFVSDCRNWHAWETPESARQELQRLVPEGELVAVTPRHWYVFQGRNPWRDAFLASLRDDHEIRHCDWLVLYPGVGLPPFLEAFELRVQVETSAFRDHTYAYALWQRRQSLPLASGLSSPDRELSPGP